MIIIMYLSPYRRRHLVELLRMDSKIKFQSTYQNDGK
jgi:hypothetical protein